MCQVQKQPPLSQMTEVLKHYELQNILGGHTCSRNKMFTHLLKDVMQLLQRRPHSPMTAHAACVTVEVDVRHSVQSVVAKGADHRRPHGAVLAVGEVGLLIVRRFIQGGIVGIIHVLSSARLEPLHQDCDSLAQSAAVVLRPAVIQLWFNTAASPRLLVHTADQTHADDSQLIGASCT